MSKLQKSQIMLSLNLVLAIILSIVTIFNLIIPHDSCSNVYGATPEISHPHLIIACLIVVGVITLLVLTDRFDEVKSKNYGMSGLVAFSVTFYILLIISFIGNNICGYIPF